MGGNVYEIKTCFQIFVGQSPVNMIQKVTNY
jgi:hypothetical protein